MSLTLRSETVRTLSPRCWAEIDLTALQHNIRGLRRIFAPSTVMAVVKANAYGLGAEAISRAALQAGASGLAVSSAEEGRDLRQAGLNAPILVLGYVPTELASLAVENNLTLTVNSAEMALALAEAVRQFPRQAGRLPVHLKLDTGLHRYGLTPSEALTLARLIGGLAGLELQGLYTHFATGDEGDTSFVTEQQNRFEQTRQMLAFHGFNFPQQHLSNSATGISYAAARGSFVRVGLAMYGYYGSDSVAAQARQVGLELQPTLSLKSRVARLSDLAPGETVGYNRTFLSSEPRRLALVPFGYADGYRRAMGNRSYVLINGQPAAVVGRVSMDQITVDITGLGPVNEGDEVVLLGRQGQAQLSLEEIAGWCDTIPYEIMTGLGPRVTRIYHQ